MTQLTWLPDHPEWSAAFKRSAGSDLERLDDLVTLARYRLDFIRTNAIDASLSKLPQDVRATRFTTKPVRLAILGSCTTAQLHPAIRVAALRREIAVSIYDSDYGQYWQELVDSKSALHEFRPNTTLFALDAHHLAAGVSAAMREAEIDAALAEVTGRITDCWRLAKQAFGCAVIQQVPLPVHLTILGNNEHRLSGSQATFIEHLSSALRSMADKEGVDLLALDVRAVRDGISAWHDRGLWHRAKQEVSPAAAPMYGELVARILAAQQGRSYKCLVMDLDNTLWGGVIGDDGIKGIILGQGSALGEAYTAFQAYARELARRGIILAVCSKNDEANALEPFESHPDMLLQRRDIACFVANWSDKATNIRAIAKQLNIGLDSLVFVDDNPFERALVRNELPVVAVPEVGDDPTYFAEIVSDAGYFEGLSITREDRERAELYQGNRLREDLRASTTDLSSYLRGLEMQLRWRRFDDLGLSRTLQLINKTNQFNLTTRRYSEQEILGVMKNPRALGLQLRLVDRFGDNGVISVVIGKMVDDEALLIDTWLMSCRVLGRQVEASTLNVIAQQASKIGAKRLIGEYIPTKKNGMVREHYAKLGFTVLDEQASGTSRAALDLDKFKPLETFITIAEG